MKAQEFIKSKGWVPNSLLSQDVVIELMEGFAKAKLEEAAERVEAYVEDEHGQPYAIVISSSITETPLD